LGQGEDGDWEEGGLTGEDVEGSEGGEAGRGDFEDVGE